MWVHSVAVLGLVVTLGWASGCAAPAARTATFRESPVSVRAGDFRGPFSGRVVDAGTDRPVDGALVYATWGFVQGVGLTEPAGYAEHVGSTDDAGFYEIPRLRVKGEDNPTRRLSTFRLVIYKKGFAPYRSDHRFGDLGSRADFAQKSNPVRLTRWRSDLSQARLVKYAGSGPTMAAATAWALTEAASELDPDRQTSVLASDRAADAPPVRAEELLDPAYVKHVTGFEGTFQVQPLSDIPTSAQYDSIHLRAEGRTEDHDAAMRLWFLPVDRLTEHYEQVIGELPNIAERDEVGTRSVRVASDAGDILGLVYLDEKHSAVVLITCGASQCRNFEAVLALARQVKDRMDALLRGGR